MQTLVKLMFRLTTNVATSPVSSARSSSAAARISSTASGRVSANRATSSSRVSSSPARPALDGAVDRIAGAERRSAAVAVRRPRRERRARRGRKVGKRSAITSSTGGTDPLVVHVLRVDAEPLGQRVAERAQPLAHLQRARERVLGGDVVAVGGEPAEVGGAGLDEVDPPVGEVRRDLDADLGHQPPALGDEPLHVLDRDRLGPGRPVDRALLRRPSSPGPSAQRRSLASAAMSATSAP